MPSAAIFGATGSTGKHILRELLSNKAITKVGEYGRRVTALESLKDDVSLDTSKLEQKAIDFDKIQDEQDLKRDWDIVYIALGTTRAAAGSAAAFEKIDREHVLAAARVVKSASNGAQRLVYVSSAGADKNAMFLYPRSKGLTEEGLAALGYSDTIIFRPGVLKGKDNQTLVQGLANAFVGAIPSYREKMQIHVADLGKAVAMAGLLGTAGLPKTTEAIEQAVGGDKFTLIGNIGALRLANPTSA